MTSVATENARISARSVGIGQKPTSVVRINAVANLNHTEKERASDEYDSPRFQTYRRAK